MNRLSSAWLPETCCVIRLSSVMKAESPVTDWIGLTYSVVEINELNSDNRMCKIRNTKAPHLITPLHTDYYYSAMAIWQEDHYAHAEVPAHRAQIYSPSQFPSCPMGRDADLQEEVVPCCDPISHVHMCWISLGFGDTYIRNLTFISLALRRRSSGVRSPSTLFPSSSIFLRMA